MKGGIGGKIIDGDCYYTYFYLLKTTHTEEQIRKVATFDLDRKKVNLIPNKSFRYYDL